MTITQARRTKKGRIALYVDGEFLFSAEESAWLSSGLFEDGEVDEDALSALLHASKTQEAKRRALNMLATRGYTARQLTDRLARRTGREAAEQAVTRMGELGYIDDEGYARRYAQILYDERHYALRRIRHELAERGVARELIDEAVAFIDPDEEEARAVRLLHGRVGAISDEAGRRRATALLQRYGYGPRAVSCALRALRDNSQETEDYEPWD